MFGNTTRITSLLLVALCLALIAPAATADEALDKAVEALKTYDWGSDRAALKPIDDAVAAAAKDAGARKQLEGYLASTVTGDVSQAAKDFVFRKLRVIGTEACVATLTESLSDPELSHMARYALQCIPALSYPLSRLLANLSPEMVEPFLPVAGSPPALRIRGDIEDPHHAGPA